MARAAAFELLRVAGSTGGNLVTDAQIATVALARRATVHTADQDFRRFPGLDCRYPLQDRSSRPPSTSVIFRRGSVDSGAHR